MLCVVRMFPYRKFHTLHGRLTQPAPFRFYDYSMFVLFVSICKSPRAACLQKTQRCMLQNWWEFGKIYFAKWRAAKGVAVFYKSMRCLCYRVSRCFCSKWVSVQEIPYAARLFLATCAFSLLRFFDIHFSILICKNPRAAPFIKRKRCMLQNGRSFLLC